MTPTILITGASGFLGHALRQELSSVGTVVPHGHSQSVAGGVQADLRDPAQVRELIGKVKPDIVVHAAAYREPDQCEDQKEETDRLNRAAVEYLATSLPEKCQLAYISTDYVFSGENPPYREEDQTDPVNEYGRSKRAGELEALQRANSLVIRVPVLIGTDADGKLTGFLKQMEDSIRSGNAEDVDDVLMRFPTSIDDVALNIRWLLENNHAGIWQVSSASGGTRYQLTLEIAEQLGLSHGHLKPSRTIIPRRATRPMNSQLSPGKLLQAGGPGCRSCAEVFQQLSGATRPD